MLAIGTTPRIYGVTMVLADTEYSHALPANCRKFLIKCRGSYPIQVCFVEDESDVNYVTVPAGMTYWEDLIYGTKLTLYFQCPVAGQVAEIVAWS
ncbi:unnamed protein product [marine sediment metagenome]|uniref:Uncharacterized protein n=1 Tax=marine sediment metagenome TaxID=412755 RepID=X1U0Z6_9ZZZZ